MEKDVKLITSGIVLIILGLVFRPLFVQLGQVSPFILSMMWFPWALVAIGGFAFVLGILKLFGVAGFRTHLIYLLYAFLQPAEQFGQDVLNTPLPSPQKLSGLSLLLSGNPSLFQSLYSETPQGMQTPIAQGQQPTTPGSLLNSAATSSSSSLNLVHFLTVIKHLFKLLTYKLFAFFSNLCFLSIYKVVSYG